MLPETTLLPRRLLQNSDADPEGALPGACPRTAQSHASLQKGSHSTNTTTLQFLESQASDRRLQFEKVE